VGHDLLEMEVNTAFGADSMSDVLTFAKPGCLLLTGLTNPQIIRTADILEIAAIIITRGKKLSPATIGLAEEIKIPVLSTKYILFEAAGRLYEKGISTLEIICCAFLAENYFVKVLIPFIGVRGCLEKV